jgi:hypothetical protein
MRIKKFVQVTALALVAASVLTGSADAALRGQITEARANLATRKIKVKGIAECFRTPGEPIPGYGITYTDGCAPDEEPIWSTISLVLHNARTAKECKPGATDTGSGSTANRQELWSRQPENVETVSFSFTRKVKLYSTGPISICLQESGLTSIPISGCGNPCFYNEVIAATKVKWFGHKPKHRV